MSLAEKIATRQCRVGVMGLGYVGLPLALEIARAGFHVIGLEKDDSRAGKVNNGQSYLEDVPQERLNGFVSNGQLKATTDFSVIADLDVVIMCVPTPLTKAKEPDISCIGEACRSVAKYLGKDKLISVESTSFPTTTEGVVLPILESEGLKVGKDFYLIFSPERIDPGSKRYGVRDIPKLVGGVTPRCTELGKLFYEQFIDHVLVVSSPRVAEMAKLLENIFRCVNIALINELMMLSERMNIDIWEVIEAASSKPFGFMPFYPGPGLGGHCIPVDPFFLSWKAREYDFHTQFIELAGNINERMPYWVVDKISAALNTHQKSLNGSRVLLLGVAYKKDVGDVRSSPALRVIELLADKGAEITYHDAHVPAITVAGRKYASAPLTRALLRESDCVAIITDHSNVDYVKVVQWSELVVDTRGVLRHLDFSSQDLIPKHESTDYVKVIGVLTCPPKTDPDVMLDLSEKRGSKWSGKVIRQNRSSISSGK